MSITTRDERRTRLPGGQIVELVARDPLLAGYAMTGVVDTAAESLAIPATAVEAGLRSGRTLRELAHELRRDPHDLQLALARGPWSTRIDDRSAGEMIAAAGRLLDQPLSLGPP
ncbi:MAG: hypothetical protein ACJ76I_03825 [Gaiellaceae bacterium]